MKNLTCLIFLLALFHIVQDPAFGQASNVRVVCDKWPGSSTIYDFAQDSIRLMGAENNEEKAIALFRFIRMWTSSTDGHIPREPALGDVYIDDPVKVLNVYGAHHCDGLSRILEMAWRSLGYRAEKLYRSRHTQANLFYKDNDEVYRWHLFDVSRGWFVFDRSGKHVASPDEIGADFSLALRPSRGPIPRKHQYWGMCNWVHAPHISWPDYSPELRLRAGEKITMFWNNISLPYQDNFRMRGKKGFEHGPYPVTYGNSLLVYAPDLSPKRYTKGTFQQPENISCSQDKDRRFLLHPSGSGYRAEIIYHVNSPYIISDAWINGYAHRGSNKDAIEIHISIDGGKTWRKAWNANELGEFELRKVGICKKFNIYKKIPKDFISPFGRYGYLIKFVMLTHGDISDVWLTDLEITTVLQHNIFALPQLWPGENIISVNGELEKDIALKVKYVWSDRLGKKRQNEVLVANTPYHYEILTAGKKWEEVKCVSLTIETLFAKGESNKILVKEKAPEKICNISISQAFATRDIIGKAIPSPLKSVKKYIQDLKNPKKQVQALTGLMVHEKATLAFEPVRDVAFNSKRFPNKDLAIQALYQIDPQKSIPFFLKILKMDPQVKWKKDPHNKFVKLEHWYNTSALIGHIVSQAGERIVVPYLVSILENIVINDDRSWESHASIIRSLGRLGDPIAAKAIIPFLHRNIDVAAQGIWALGELNRKEAIPDIRALFYKSNYPVIKTKAAEALGKLGDKKIIPDLLQMLEHPDENFRAAAVESLGRLGAIEAIPYLKTLLYSDYCPWIKEMVRINLIRLGESSAILENPKKTNSKSNRVQ